MTKLDRRQLLTGLGAVAAVAAMPGPVPGVPDSSAMADPLFKLAEQTFSMHHPGGVFLHYLDPDGLPQIRRITDQALYLAAGCEVTAVEIVQQMGAVDVEQRFGVDAVLHKSLNR